MKRNNLPILILFLWTVLFIFSCKEKSNCEKLPAQFSSYAEAKIKIKESYFKIQEEVNTSKSSWIRGASYYSCDGNTGFFVLQTDKKDYLYSNMPYTIWSEFKNAESFGKYYNQSIRNRYRFQLKK